MMESEIFTSRHFRWAGKIGYATLDGMGLTDFPKTFTVRSAKTDQERRFVVDPEVNEANDFFDGEAKAYMTAGGTVTVRIQR